MSKFDDAEDRNLQTATLEVLENNKYFKAFISKYYPTYSDFESTFDMYALVGSYYQEYKYCDTAVMIVEKGSKVCYVKDLSNGQWGGGYNEMIFTNSEHIFAIVKPNKDFNEGSWAFYDGSGDAGQSGIAYLSAADGYDGTCSGKRMEHDACTYSQPPHRGILLLQCTDRQLYLPLHGRASGRTHRMDAERTGYHVTGMVYPRCCRNKQLYVHLGHGW